MESNTSTVFSKQALLGAGAALLISTGPNLWLAMKRAEVEAAQQKAATSSLVLEKNPTPAGSTLAASEPAKPLSKKISPDPPEEGKDLSALFTAEMQTIMEGWSEWRSWWEASYLKLVTGAPAPVVDAWQTYLSSHLKSRMSALADEEEKSGAELRQEEEDWLRQNLTPAQWAAWQQHLISRKAADLEAMAEETLYSVSQHLSLTPSKKEALYALAVAESKKAFDGEWSRSVQFGIGISTTEPVQSENWADDIIRSVLTPEQWQVWEPATTHTRNLPDQLMGGMAAGLLDAVRQHDLADILGQASKEMSAGMEKSLKAEESKQSTPDDSESK